MGQRIVNGDTMSFSIDDPSMEDATQGAPLFGAHTLAQATALAWHPRQPVEGWSVNGGQASTSGIAATTWQLQFATRNKAHAVRVSYINPLTSAPVVDKTTITASTSYAQDGDPVGGAAPVNVLFSGAAPCNMVAAASVAVATFNQSDWTLLSPVDRADVPGGLSLWHLRSYCALSGQPYKATLASAPYAGNVAAGLIRRGSTMAGDKIAVPAGYVGANPGLILSMALEFRTLGRVLRLGVIGDSIAAGTEAAAVEQNLTSYAEMACNIVNGQLITSMVREPAYWSAFNFGWGAQVYSQFAARLPAILAAFQLDAMLIPVWCPNTPPTTQAQLDTNIGQLLDMISRCVAARVVPILVTSPPRDVLGNPGDNFRKQMNDTARAVAAVHGYLLADTDAVLSNNATPAAYLVGTSDDGLHPNATGKALEAAVVAAKLPYAVPL